LEILGEGGYQPMPFGRKNMKRWRMLKKEEKGKIKGNESSKMQKKEEKGKIKGNESSKMPNWRSKVRKGA
jgi:acetoin utilization deacetylase AcuC-like enzyme